MRLYPERRARYRSVSWPFVDLSVGSYGNDTSKAQDVNALGRGDLAGMTGTGFFRMRRGSVDETTGWFNFERTDLDQGLLGPLLASNVTVGDVFTRGISLVSPGRRGRGFKVSNREINARRFDTTDVQGAAPPGWDAELYVNGTLRAFQSIGETGRYLFKEIPIYGGTTLMRVVLYGPQGQEREELQYINAGPNPGQAGQLTYDAFVVQNELSMFGTNLWSRPTIDEGAFAHHVGLGYGFTRTLGAEVAFDHVPTDGVSYDLLSLRGTTSIGRAFWRLEHVENLQRGNLTRLGLTTRLASQNILLDLARYDDYVANVQRITENDEWTARFRMAGLARLPGDLPLGYSMNLDHRAVDSSSFDSITSVKLRGTVHASRLQFVHELTLQQSRYSTIGDVSTSHGTQLVSGYYKRTRLRGSVQYANQKSFDIQAVGLSAQRLFRRGLSGQALLQHFALEDPFTRLSGRLNVQSSDVIAGIELRYDTNGRFEWGLTLSSAFSVRPDQRSIEISGERAASNGAAITRTFIDHDGDGSFGPMDEPLEGVSFRRNERWRDRATDERGTAWLTGIQANQRVNVELDLSSVFDPFLVPHHEGLTTVVHRGGIAELEFPFSYVGDIEGMVFRDLLRHRPMANVGLELVDPIGERVATAVTEFDGYYVFQRVAPGPYKIRIVDSTLPHLDFILPKPQPVVVPKRGDFVQGPEFVLVREGERLDLKFAEEEGAPEAIDAASLVGEGASDAVLARVRALLDATDGPVSFEDILGDAELTEAERRTLEILYELYFDGDGVYRAR